MQSYFIYIIFVLCSPLPFLIATWIIFKYKLPVWLHISHLVPSVIALTMFYIFTLNEGATVAQFSVDEPRSSMWSLWVDVFLIVIFSAIISAIGNFVALLVSLFRQRRWTAPASVASIGLAISVFALFAAATNFPTA